MKGISIITKNPLNIRYNSRNQWLGQSGQYKGFCMFKSVSYGFRAAYWLLNGYIKRDINTIEAIVSRWAPSCENDTENYINFVSNDVMIPRNKKLTSQSIHDYWTIIMILRAMAKMECGEWFEEQSINLFICYPEKFCE